MKKIGDILSYSRTSKQLTVENVCKELKISKNAIISIENNIYPKNTDIVFYLGHVKSYSNFLDLDTAELIKSYKSEISFLQNKNLSQKIPKPNIENSFKFQKIFSVSLVGIIFTSFYLLFINKGETTRDYALVPDLPESYIPIIEELETSSYKSEEVIISNNLQEKENINYSSAVASNEINKLKITENNITLKLLNPTWVQIRDMANNIILSKLMEKDEEFSYGSELNYNITAGNAGNIIVIINNDVRGKIGKYGEILDSYILDKNFNN